MKRALVLGTVLVLVAHTFRTEARAGEIQADLAYTARKSAWRGDWTGGAQLGLGYRFARMIAVDFVGWNELARVDSRMNTGLTFGVTGAIPREGIRPTLRLYFIHQHEEGLVSVVEHPFGTLAGIGSGIRHRAGAGARIGVEIPLDTKRPGAKTEWVALVSLDTTWFPDATLGPSLYMGIMAGAGFNYTLEGLP